MPLFEKNLNFLFYRLDVMQKEIASQLKKSSTTIANWRDGKSSPDVEELAGLVHFFGISADVLIFEDIEKGKLITDEMVREFKLSGKLTGKVMGKLMANNHSVFAPEGSAQSIVHQGQQAAEWILLKKMEELNENFSLLRVSVEKAIKK